MKSTEFRIGNLIKCDENILIVEEIIKNGITTEDYGLHFDIIQPIPLTEELLLKCGFVKYSNDILVFAKKYYYVKSNKTIMIGQEPFCTIEYLHTLQNFFALTNQELKIIL